MSKRQKNTQDGQINEMVKKIKTVLIESIVREWLNTPVKEWGNKTPLQMANKGEGQKILDSIKQMEEDFKKERKNGPNNSTIEKSLREEESCHPILCNP